MSSGRWRPEIFRDSTRLKWLEVPAAMIFYFLTHAVMRPELLQNFATGFIGGFRGDPGIYIYHIMEIGARVLTWPSEGLNGLWFYPWGRSLAYTDSFLLPAAIVKCGMALSGSLSFWYNVVFTLAFVLNGACVYFLAKRFCGSRPAALCAGLMFQLYPYFEFHRGHPQLQFGFFVPLILLCSLRYCESRTVLWATSIGAVVAASFCCSAYYTMFSYVAAGLLIGAYALARHSTIGWRDVLILALANVPWLAALVPLMLPYQEVQATLGSVHPWVLMAQSATWLAYFAAPRNSAVWGQITHPLSKMEGWLFPGAVAWLLGAAGIAMAASVFTRSVNRPGLRRWAVVGGAICVLSLGSAAVVSWAYPAVWDAAPIFREWSVAVPCWLLLAALGASLWRRGSQPLNARELGSEELLLIASLIFVFFGFASFGIVGERSMPFFGPELFKLLTHLPGFGGLRGVSRIGMISGLGLMLLAANALAALISAARRRGPRFSTGVCVVVFALTVGDLWTRCGENPVPPRRPEVFDELEKLPGKEGVIVVPSGQEKGSTTAVLFTPLIAQWLQPTGRPIVNGYSGRMPFTPEEFGAKFDAFPDRKVLRRISSYVGVRYVIYHSPLALGPTRRAAYLAAKDFPEYLTLLARGSDGSRLYRFQSRLPWADPAAHTICFRPDTRHWRKLSFQVEVKGGTGDSPIGMVLRTSDFASGGPEEAVLQYAPIDPAGSPKTYTVNVPPSTRKVFPHCVEVVNVDPRPGAEVTIVDPIVE